MSVFSPDYVTVEIDGVDRTAFIIDYHRYDSICELGQEFTFTMSPDMPDVLEPYQDVLIEEHYDGNDGTVIRGFVISFSRDFIGSNWTIQGHDKSILLFDYFIGEQVTSNGENVDFWMQYMADLVGLNLTFQAVASSQSIVADETPLGMQHAGDAVLSLERIAGYFVKYDSNLDSLVTYRLGSSEPVMTISSALEATRELGTEKTRNVVKIYGGYRFNPDDLGVTQIFASARSNIPELLVDKTVVVANPNLNRQTYAFIVAHRLLNVVNSLDDVQFYTLPGFYPDLQVGQVVYINLPNNYYIQYEGDRVITSIEAQLDQNGATTIIGIGDKCPRIAIVLPVPPVYATTEQDGVAVSFNGGDSFKTSNIGLTGVSGYMDGRSIAVNSYGQQMVVTASGLFRRASSLATWINISANLDAPVNDALDDPPFSVPFTSSGITVTRVADETTHRNVFHLLANSGTDPERCWIYTTEDFGQTWVNKQVTVLDTYNVKGIDLESDVSNRAYALVQVGRISRFATAFYNWGFYDDPDISPAAPRGYVRVLDRDGNYETRYESNFIRGLVSVPRDRTIVYIKDGNDILRSLNSGIDWETVYEGPFDSSGETTYDHFIFNGDLLIDEASLADNNIVRLFSGAVLGLDVGTVGWPGPPKGIFSGTFFEDDITLSAATATSVAVDFPSMIKSYTEVNPDDEDDTNTFTTGENLREDISDPQNDYSMPNGVNNAHWGAFDRDQSQVVQTMDPEGDNVIYMQSLAYVRPVGDMFGQSFPGHLKTFVCKFIWEDKTASIVGEKLFLEFALTTSTQTSEPFQGPEAPSLYPREADNDNRQRDDSHPDGNEGGGGSLRTYISSNALNYGIQVTGLGAFLEEVKAFSFGGSITGPTHIDYSGFGWTDNHIIRPMLKGVQGFNTNASGTDGILDSIFAAPLGDSQIISPTYSELVNIEGEIISMNQLVIVDTIGKKYLLVRDDFDSGEPLNERGLYNIYEASANSDTYTPVFPTSIKGMVRESSGFPIGTINAYNGFIAIAEEEDEEV